MHRSELSGPPISRWRAGILGAATLAIAARASDSLHGGVGLALPEPILSLASAATLVAAMIAAIVWITREGRRCKRLRLRALIERGTRRTRGERWLAVTWTLLGAHALVSVLR